MILTEVLAKSPADLTEEEKTFLLEHKDILSDADKERFKDVVAGLVEGASPALVLEEVVAKAPADLTEEEKTFLVANVDQLSEDDQTKFKDVLAAGSSPNPNKPYPGK